MAKPRHLKHLTNKKWKQIKSGLSLKKKKDNSKLIEFSNQLNKNLPKSEQWFMSLYKDYLHSGDKFNEPFKHYIPDVQNKRFRYIIEIDGSIHNLESIKTKDLAKTWFYQSNRYKVFRIKAYDLLQFKEVIQEILKIRES